MDRLLVAAFVATLIAAVAAVVGMPVLAQEPPATAPVPGDDAVTARARLMAMDTDHDGRWSKAEWLAGGRKARGFDRMDTDHDGYLTLAEIDAGRARMKAMRVARGTAQ